MGYGVPAALGAKAAFPERPVVAIEGDGCFQMCGMELASAVQERLPVIVVLINDGSLTLIKLIQERRYGGRFLGVDMIDSTGDKSELLMYFLSHRSVVSFGRSWRNSEKTRTPMLLFPSSIIENGSVSGTLPFLDEN